MFQNSKMTLKSSNDYEIKGLDQFQYRSIKAKLKSLFSEIQSVKHENPEGMYKTITCKMKMQDGLYIYSQVNYSTPDVGEILQRLEKSTKIQIASYKLYSGYKPQLEKKKYLLFMTIQVVAFCKMNYPGTILTRRDEREEFALQMANKYSSAKEAITNLDSEVRKKLNIASVDDLF